MKYDLLGKPLSAKEGEILQVVADGCTNPEAGLLLGLSPLTIKSHLARIALKLGTGKRAQQVAIAYRQGVVR